MRYAVICVLFCCSFCLKVFASNLPPEHESARLLLVIEEAVSQRDWELADKSLSQIINLETTLPVPFFYYNGLVHFQFNRYEKAQRSLERYVVTAGPSGAFYYEALRLLTVIEKSLKDLELSQKSTNIIAGEEEKEQSPVLVSEEQDTYVQMLKSLFLTDSSIDALVMQINSLLGAHAFTGVRLKKISEKVGVKYQVSMQDNLIILQETNYQNGFPRLSSSRLEVSGLDPFIRHECDHEALACWLYHPASDHDVWLKIGYDELVIEELGQAFTRLIQLMQK